MAHVSPNPTEQYSLGDALRFLAWFTFSLWLLLALEQRLTAEVHADTLAEQLYLLRLAAAVAPLVALPWMAAQWSAARFALGSKLAPALLASATAVGFWWLAAPIVEGDGVRALPIKAGFLLLLFVVLGLALVLTLWACSRLRSALWAVPPQAALAGGLFAFTLAFDRTYASLASVALLLSALAVANVAERAVARDERRSNLAAGSVGGFVLVTLLWGALASASIERGRALVLVDQRVPIELDSRLFGPDLEGQAAARLSLEGLTPEVCEDLPGRARPPKLKSDSDRRRNVLLVSIDALRRDVLGTKVKGKRIAPNLFAWANRSQLVPHASTTFAATLLSVSGAMTGMSASRNLLMPTPPESLFRAVRKQIPRRIAILPKTGFFKRDSFKRYVLQRTKVQYAADASKQTDALLTFIKEARGKNERFLAWTHFGEPHESYRKHKGFDFGGGKRGRYFSEVAFADAQFGRLIKQLEQDGSLNDTLIIVFSDHGEALGERGYYGHHVFLNRWVAEIPMILHVPSGERLRTGSVAQTADIAPTVLHFLGLKQREHVTGRSLLGQGAGPNRAVVTEAFAAGGASMSGFARTKVTSMLELERRMDMVQRGFDRYPPSVSITQGDERLIVNRRVGLTTLYDITKDPKEQHDLSQERPERRRELLEKLTKWHESQSRAVYCATLATLAKRAP